jgi:acetyl-CoA carboxylase carboxyl transferase subunit alpha
MEMSGLRVPVVAVVIGEGGSGGAIGIAVANRVLMMENSVYSVIPPEGCAAILWRDPTRGRDAAEALKITSDEALKMGVIEEIISEPLGGAHRNPDVAATSLKKAILRNIEELESMSADDLAQQRYDRFRAIGAYRVAEIDE